MALFFFLALLFRFWVCECLCLCVAIHSIVTHTVFHVCKDRLLKNELKKRKSKQVFISFLLFIPFYCIFLFSLYMWFHLSFCILIFKSCQCVYAYFASIHIWAYCHRHSKLLYFVAFLCVFLYVLFYFASSILHVFLRKDPLEMKWYLVCKNNFNKNEEQCRTVMVAVVLHTQKPICSIFIPILIICCVNVSNKNSQLSLLKQFLNTDVHPQFHTIHTP